jgi:hypothetical protein
MNVIETANATDVLAAQSASGAIISEQAKATGKYFVRHLRPLAGKMAEYLDICGKIEKALEAGQLFLAENLEAVKTGLMYDVCEPELADNVTCDEGVRAMLTNALKGSAYTAVNYMGLISSVSYGAGPVAGDTMASHAGWLEAGTTNAPTFAARLAPAFGTAATRTMPQSATTNFTMTGAGTVKGAFLAIKDAAGVAPTSAALNTSGAMWSAGTFTDKVVQANDVIQVTYSTSL